MYKTLFFALLLVVFVLGTGKKGIVELDELSFDRVADGSKPVLVAFLEYSWKDPEDYDKVAEELKEVIVAKVDCSSNEKLKTKYHIKSYPTYQFFDKETIDKEPPSLYGGEIKFYDVINFVKMLQKPKLRELKNYAAEFMKEGADRKKIIDTVEHLVSGFSQVDNFFGGYYVTAMKKIEEKGDDFVKKELERLNALIENKGTKEDKRREFGAKVNILNNFHQEIV